MDNEFFSPANLVQAISSPREPLDIHRRHREILRLGALGDSATVIAEKMGITAGYVSKILNSENTQQHLEKLQDERDRQIMATKRELNDAMHTAALVLKELVDNAKMKPEVRLQAAREILGRTAFPVKKESHNVSMSLTAEDLNMIKERARKAGAILDVESETTYESSEEELTSISG